MSLHSEPALLHWCQLIVNCLWHLCSKSHCHAAATALQHTVHWFSFSLILSYLLSYWTTILLPWHCMATQIAESTMPQQTAGWLQPFYQFFFQLLPTLLLLWRLAQQKQLLPTPWPSDAMPLTLHALLHRCQFNLTVPVAYPATTISPLPLCRNRTCCL